MTNGDASYTGVVQQVLVQLGRIEGKLDSFDQRLRVVEEQQAAWREVTRVQRIEGHENRLLTLEAQRTFSDSLKHYWYVAAAVVIPVAINSSYVLSKIFGHSA